MYFALEKPEGRFLGQYIEREKRENMDKQSEALPTFLKGPATESIGCCMGSSMLVRKQGNKNFRDFYAPGRKIILKK